MPLKILVLPGDGIGPEITRATLQVLRSADAAFSLGLEFEIQDIGFASLRSQGTTLPQAVLARIPEVDGVILSPVSHYDYPSRQQGGINPSAERRVGHALIEQRRLSVFAEDDQGSTEVSSTSFARRGRMVPTWAETDAAAPRARRPRGHRSRLRTRRHS